MVPELRETVATAESPVIARPTPLARGGSMALVLCPHCKQIVHRISHADTAADRDSSGSGCSVVTPAQLRDSPTPGAVLLVGKILRAWMIQ